MGLIKLLVISSCGFLLRMTAGSFIALGATEFEQGEVKRQKLGEGRELEGEGLS